MAVQENAKSKQREFLEHCRNYLGVIGQSLQRRLNELVPFVRGSARILITGERGTGKELLAKAIHYYSRPATPLVWINCGDLRPELARSEFFGHERGAFTGAVSDRRGLLEEANSGTLFLDEVACLDSQVQKQLLRVFETGEYRRVGNSHVREFKGRVILATNGDPETGPGELPVRSDLLDRLNDWEIELPPIRQQIESVVPAFTFHVCRWCAEQQHEVPYIEHGSVVPLLVGYDWPGNFREIRRFARAAARIATFNECHINAEVVDQIFENKQILVDGFPTMRERKRRGYEEALAVTEGNVEEAAKLLGIGTSTAYEDLRRFGIDRSTYKNSVSRS